MSRLQEQASRGLEQLYEISKLFASFGNAEQTFDAALGIAVKALPLRSAILIETEEGHSRMIVWPAEGQSAEQMRAATEHGAAAYRYLAGAGSTASIQPISEQAGLTALPRPAGIEISPTARFIVIPLVVAYRPLFGALQVEGAQPLDETDLMFVNAIANQLAVAIDRDRAWRQNITRREHAEAKGATAERDRRSAESSSERYEALARENARLYGEAQQAVRVREQLLAIVSHDLRNPLGTILMTADALAKKGTLPLAVGRIQRAANHMRRLIEDLLDFASINAGRLAIKRRPQDPGSMIQETLASFEGVAQEKELQLTANVEPYLPQVYCDYDRIIQVFSNLVSNATKVTAEGGQISLRAEARGHEVLFTVSDNGPGISEEDVKHLFERYWRSDEAEYKGTGLGLAIASGIVGAHGGRIWAESEFGRGAKFLFTIPTADMTMLFTAPAPETSPPAQGVKDTGTADGA